MARLAAEFVVLVIGVLVALGVDRWVAGIDERDQEFAYLTELRADFVRNRALAENGTRVEGELAELAVVAIPWSLLGASIGTGFGALVAVTDAKRSLEELPLWRMGLFGALAGAMFLPAYVLLREGMGPLLDLGMLPFMGVFGAFGAILSSSMVSLAKDAHRDELSAADEVVALLEVD